MYVVGGCHSNDGFDSTAGTTATVCLLRGRLLWTAHVGDSRAVVSVGKEDAVALTKDHKTGDAYEVAALEARGGQVSQGTSYGPARVVWRRKRRTQWVPPTLTGSSTKGAAFAAEGGGSSSVVTPRPEVVYQELPFLNMTRSLGDLWSFSSDRGKYAVSPNPEVRCWL